MDIHNFHDLLNEFEHACRGGDYEISKQLKKEIVKLVDYEEEETANVLADLCQKIDWLTQELERQKSFWMRKYVNEKEKAEKYKKALENIEDLEFFTNFSDKEKFAAALYHAKNALEVNER
ncbi:hypothetical protein [Geobacillus sp. AYS3]|nr:hypothetical protein [Geobacillus sp. AYS3]PUF85787.1 hypothetical protein DCC82_15615 [Geobacillus sp. LYN3]TXK89044.1 hypothetical protein FVE68_01500 [Geobacillus sp. AYS3]